MRIVLKNVSLFFPTICVFPADRILFVCFLLTPTTPKYSLPPAALRNPMRRSEAVETA
jgi:hypothetical protein